MSQGLLSRALTSKAKGWLALAFAVAALCSVVALWPQVYCGLPIDVSLAAFDGPIGLTYHVDGLSLLFALMGTGIGSAVLLYSVSYMAEDPSATRFYVLMQIFIAGLVNLVFSADLLLLYVSWEVVGVCSFLLVGFWYTRDDAAAGARKVLVITHIAGYALLGAILVLYARTGTTLWTDPRMTAAFTTGIFALMLVAAMAKSVQFPLHTWIPSAMAAPTPVSSLLHSACYVTAGVYLVARMHSIGVWPAGWQTVVVWVGTVTMVVGILFAMIQSDAKRLLAFSTVSQLGYMMLGLGLGTPLGILAGLLHLLNHGLFKGGLFLLAGGVQHATGTRDMDKLGGLKRSMPVTTVLWLVFAASVAGVPLFNGFVSKWLIYVAALDAGFAAPALIAWIVSIMTMFVMLKATTAIFFGEDGKCSASAHESPAPMLVGSGVLAVGCVVLGIVPQLAIVYAVAPALAGVGMTSNVVTGWLGVSALGSTFSATAGLVLALASILVGGSTYWLFVRRKVSSPAPAHASLAAAGAPSLLVPLGPTPWALPSVPRAQAGASSETFSGGLPLSLGWQLRAHDFSVLVERGLAPFFAWADPDRYWLILWHFTLRVAALLGRVSCWLEDRGVATLVVVAVLIGGAADLFSGVARVGGSAPGAALSLLPLAIAASVSFVALLLSLGASELTRRRIWFGAPAGVLVLAGLLSNVELVRLALVESAAFTAVALLVASGVDRRARNAYLLAAALSAGAQVSGVLLRDTAPAGIVLALLLVGFSVKLALVPVYVWLPRVAEKTPAAIIGLILAVVDIVAFAELIELRHAAGWLFTPAWPWLGVAMLSAVGGAVLALSSRGVRRMLAFSTVAGAGFIVLAVTMGGSVGLDGALKAAIGESLGVALLFASLSSVEANAPLTLASRGVARHRPLAAAGFLLGAFTVLGIPLTAGFAGHWRVYATALSAGPGYLALLFLATILLVLAFVRVIALVWWGGADETGAAEPAWDDESAPLNGPIVVLMMAVIVAGVFPRIL